MATEKPNLNGSAGITDSDLWNGVQGVYIEDYIKRKIDCPFSVEQDSERNTQFNFKSAGSVFATMDIATANVKPVYETTFTINRIEINNQSYSNAMPIEANGAGVNSAKVYYTLTSTYNIAGQTFNNTGIIPVSIGFSTDTSGELKYKYDQPFNLRATSLIESLDITDLFLKNILDETLLYFTVSYKIPQGDADTIIQNVLYPGIINIKTYTISYNSTNVITTGNITFDSNQTNGYLAYYVDNSNIQFKNLSLGKDISLSPGVHTIAARIQNTNTTSPTLFSKWLPLTIIYLTDSLNATVAITDISQEVLNCSSNRIFKIISTSRKQGNVSIYVFKDETRSNIASISTSNYLSDNNKRYLYKKINIQLEADKPSLNNTYSLFVEQRTIQNLYFKFIIVPEDGSAQIFNYPNIVGNLILMVNNVQEIKVLPETYKGNNELIHVYENKVEEFSQIKDDGIFDNVNENLDISDGIKSDDEYTWFKASPIIDGVFKDGGYKLTNTNGSAFTGKLSIEMLIKTYNIADPNDEIFRIGNIKVYPTYLRVDTGTEDWQNSKKPEATIYYASKAEFASNELTHIMITYDDQYIPKSYDYSNMYNGMLNRSYPCLKIYINGTINRVVSVAASAWQGDLKFQINPQSSNVNFYIFRTYNKCLDYLEVERNRISAMSKLKDKCNYYIDNNIYYKDGSNKGLISLDKCLGIGENTKKRNIILYVLNDKGTTSGGNGVVYSSTTTPFYFGAKNIKYAQASILVEYAKSGDNYEAASGRLFPPLKTIKDGKEYYKGQGSSAKKYGGAWNTQYSKFKYVKKEDFSTERDSESNASDFYKMPEDSITEIKKTCGKVNYASSLQSHKQGATKIYDILYKNCVNPELSYRKAVLEDLFLYFYVLLSDCKEGTTLSNVTWDSFPHTSAKFFGFQTWGSAKMDEKTFGVNNNMAVLEGADNKNACTNFKVPWAAQQMWNPEKVSEGFDYYGSYGTQKSLIPDNFLQLTGLNEEGTAPDYINGLYIWDETIQYRLKIDSKEDKNSDERNPDSWDCSNFITDPDETTKQCSLKEGGAELLSKFAEFYNYIYTFDATSLEYLNDLELGNKINLSELSKNKKYVVENNFTIDGLEFEVGDVIRYDPINDKWVSAGLYYNTYSGNGQTKYWDKFNVINIYNDIQQHLSNGTDSLYEDIIDRSIITEHDGQFVNFDSIMNEEFKGNNSLEIIKRAFSDMFKCVVHKYCNENDFVFHQAMMRILSGTDNRAKNTYWVIRDEEKIELFQDDLDTIFKTDNNGQLIKPYDLLEPEYDQNQASMWGDSLSGFFTNFDIIYEDEIKQMLKKILDACNDGNHEGDLFQRCFFSVQENFPAYSYNHTSEIYYETVQSFFHNGKGDSVSWSGFTNNQVSDPISLSHGSCLETERQFLKDRLLMLGSYCGSSYGLTGESTQLKSDTSVGTEEDVNIEIEDVLFNVFNYPNVLNTKLDHHANDENYPKIAINDVDIIHNNNTTGYLSYLNELAGLNDNYKFSAERKGISGLTAGNGAIENSDLIKSITIKKGQQYLGPLNFPNAEIVKVDGSEEPYIFEGPKESDTLDVANYLPCVKELELKAVTFDKEYVRFTDCTRLEKLDLSDVITLRNLTLPRSNKLSSLTLPSNLTQLIVGHYPNLSEISFTGSGTVNRLIIDANNSFLNELIENNLSNSAELVEINNNNSGITLSPLALNKLLNTSSLILKGTINIDGDVDWKLKERLAIKFGNIDDPTNIVYCNYTKVTPTSISFNYGCTIDLPDPSFKSRDYSLLIKGSRGKDANDIAIEGNKLKIRYSVKKVTAPSDALLTIDDLGYLTSPVNKGTFELEIYLIDNSSISCKGNITLGFRAPQFGDFAYSDGTFSEYFKDGGKDIIGTVFYSKLNTSTNKYDVRILGTEAISASIGPSLGTNDYYWESTYDTSWEIEFLYAANTIGNPLIRSMLCPHSDIEGYVSQLPTGDIKYDDCKNYLDSNPSAFITDHGYELTKRGQEIGRITYNNLRDTNFSGKTASELRSILPEYNNINYDNFDRLLTLLNLGLSNSGRNFDLSSMLLPLATKTGLYEPKLENLKNSYSKGNWYIPSANEIHLLLSCLIRSCTNNTKSSYNNMITNDHKNVNSNYYTDNYALFSKLKQKGAYSICSSFVNIPSYSSIETSHIEYGTTIDANSRLGRLIVFGKNDSNNYNWLTSSWYESSVLRRNPRSVVPCCKVLIDNKE